MIVVLVDNHSREDSNMAYQEYAQTNQPDVLEMLGPELEKKRAANSKAHSPFNSLMLIALYISCFLTNAGYYS
jgi:hypothetical protein